MGTFQLTYTPDRFRSLMDHTSIQKRIYSRCDRFFICLPINFSLFYLTLCTLISIYIGIYYHVSTFYTFPLFAIPGYLFSRRVVRPYSRRVLIDRVNEREPLRQTTFTADARGIIVTDGLRTVELRWPAIRDVAQFRHGVGVVTYGLSMHIPNSAFIDAAQRASLIALAKEHLEPKEAQSQA